MRLRKRPRKVREPRLAPIGEVHAAAILSGIYKRHVPYRKDIPGAVSLVDAQGGEMAVARESGGGYGGW